MGIGDMFRGKSQQKKLDEVIEGVIVAAPTTLSTGGSDMKTMIFRLDSRPDLEFRQPITPLAAVRHRGERVKVHCHVNGDGSAQVVWVEKV